MLIRSHISCATSSVCVLIRMATPRSLILRKTSLISRAPRGSRPTIGSSTSDRARPVQERGAHHQPLLHAVREALDQLVLPAPELEQLEHLAHAIADRRLVEPVEAAVKAQELAGRQLLVDERPIGDEAERRLGALRARVARSWPLTRIASGGRLQQSGDHPDASSSCRRRSGRESRGSRPAARRGVTPSTAVNVPYCLTRSWTAIIVRRRRPARSTSSLRRATGSAIASGLGIERPRPTSTGVEFGASSRSRIVHLQRADERQDAPPACRARRARAARASRRRETG